MKIHASRESILRQCRQNAIKGLLISSNCDGHFHRGYLVLQKDGKEKEERTLEFRRNSFVRICIIIAIICGPADSLYQ